MTDYKSFQLELGSEVNNWPVSFLFNCCRHIISSTMLVNGNSLLAWFLFFFCGRQLCQSHFSVNLTLFVNIFWKIWSYGCVLEVCNNYSNSFCLTARGHPFCTSPTSLLFVLFLCYHFKRTIWNLLHKIIILRDKSFSHVYGQKLRTKNIKRNIANINLLKNSVRTLIYKTI